MGVPVLSPDQREFLSVLAGRIVPEWRKLDAAGLERSFALIEEALASRPASMRRQFRLFLRAVRWLPAFRFGRPFERLEPAAQDAVLGWLQDAPVALIRKGFWGLKTLVFLGYYGRHEAGEAVGYRPLKAGNTLLHGR